MPSSGVNRASVNETTLSELIAKNQRALLYAGDYANFTNNDPLAWDNGKYMYNGGAGEEVNNMAQSFQAWDGYVPTIPPII